MFGVEGMSSWPRIFLFLYSLTGILAQELVNVTIIINGSATIAQTDDNFVCATLDWWPPNKCNYNQCPWGMSSIINLDTNHPSLAKAIQAFNSLRIRVGGTLQDQVVYGVSSLGYPCVPFAKKEGELFGFSRGCLSMERWDTLYNLFQKTGAVVTFGLNALDGRHHKQNGLWGGSWNSTNARDFIEYTISKRYQVDSWEFGNELSGHGIGASIDADLYGKDLIALKAIVDELYNKSHSRPLLVAPGGFFNKDWYTKLLEVSGSGVINGLSHHIYNLGGGDDQHLKDKILDPHYLSQIEGTFRDLQLTVQGHGPWASPWVSEAGGAYNSGGHQVSDTFINSFWYLDQLGMSAKYNTRVYCRQALVGGNYGLLTKNNFIPNPDYYSALLWHRLMGKGVLSVDINGSSFLRAYAHCSKQKAGITLLLINLSNNTEFSIQNDTKADLGNGSSISKERSFILGVDGGSKSPDGGSKRREEYHLTPKDGNHQSQIVLLNGKALELAKDGGIPALNPASVDANSPISIAPFSIKFVLFPYAEVQACM